MKISPGSQTWGRVTKFSYVDWGGALLWSNQTAILKSMRWKIWGQSKKPSIICMFVMHTMRDIVCTYTSSLQASAFLCLPSSISLCLADPIYTFVTPYPPVFLSLYYGFIPFFSPNAIPIFSPEIMCCSSHTETYLVSVTYSQQVCEDYPCDYRCTGWWFWRKCRHTRT